MQGYLAISAFDLASLGIVLIAVNDFIGVAKNNSSILPGANLDGTALVDLPLVWLAKFFVVLFANYWVVRFSQSTILKIRSRLVTSLFYKQTS